MDASSVSSVWSHINAILVRSELYRTSVGVDAMGPQAHLLEPHSGPRQTAQSGSVGGDTTFERAPAAGVLDVSIIREFLASVSAGLSVTPCTCERLLHVLCDVMLDHSRLPNNSNSTPSEVAASDLHVKPHLNDYTVFATGWHKPTAVLNDDEVAAALRIVDYLMLDKDLGDICLGCLEDVLVQRQLRTGSVNEAASSVLLPDAAARVTSRIARVLRTLPPISRPTLRNIARGCFHHMPNNAEEMALAAQWNHEAAILASREADVPWDTQCVVRAARHYHLNLLTRLLGEGCPWDPSQLLSRYLMPLPQLDGIRIPGAKLEMCTWVLLSFPPLSCTTSNEDSVKDTWLFSAIEGAHLDLLKWAFAAARVDLITLHRACNAVQAAFQLRAEGIDGVPDSWEWARGTALAVNARTRSADSLANVQTWLTELEAASARIGRRRP
jgi:hypothetical protein